MLIKFFFHLWLFIFIGVSPIIAVDLGSYSIIHFNDENGLPQNSVKGIARDTSGFIWLATESGLVRFDGQRFFIYDKSRLPILSNRILGFRPVPSVDDSIGFSALAENHEHIQILTSGTAIVNKSFPGSYRTNFPAKVKQPYGPDIMMSYPSHLFTGYLTHGPYFFKGKHGRYYMWHNTSVETYNERRHLATARITLKEFFLLAGVPLGRLPDGHFVRVHDNAVDTLSFVSETIPNQQDSVRSSKLFWDCISNAAYLYYKKNLYSLHVDVNEKSLKARLILADFDFESRNIQCVYYDGRGAFWLGSHTQGLFVVKEKPFKTLISRNIGFDNVFYAQMPPLFGHNYDTSPNYEPPAGIRSLTKHYVASNPDGTLWMARGSSIVRFDKDAQRVITKVDFNWQIKALYNDEFKNLWVASNLDTLFVASNTTAAPVFRVAAVGAFGEISCMRRVSSNQLLFGTKTGLFLLDIDTGVISAFKTFAGIQIRSLLKTGKYTWVTTYGNGIYRILGNQVIKLPLDKAKFMATSHCIVEDDMGYFWITTNKGLFKVLKADMEDYRGRDDEIFYLYYDRSYGFNTNEFNGGCQPCGVKDARGQIFFPSMNGVVYFDPISVKPELPDKRIYVSHIEVDGKFSQPNKSLHLPRSFKEVHILLTTPYFGNHNNLNLSYSFHRADAAPEWLEVPADFVVRRPNLGPGTYLLTIKNLKGFGRDSETTTLVTVQIDSAWYETRWFKLLITLVALAAFWGILEKRSAYLVNEQKRKNIYRQYHLSSKIVAAILHDIQTPLQYVSRRLNHLQNTRTGNQFIDYEVIDTIERTRTRTANLLQYIRNQSRSGKPKLALIPTDVGEIISDSLRLLSGIIVFKEISVINNVKNKTFVNTDPHLMGIVIHNALDNSVKFSESIVEINLDKTDNEVILRIYNTGTGISDTTIAWLNRPFKTYDAWMLDFNSPEDIGLGLLIIKDLCILLGVKIVVSSEVKQGTCFTFYLPYHSKSVGHP